MTLTKGLTFYLRNKIEINVLITVEEFDDGQLIISAKYGHEDIGSRITSIANHNIIDIQKERVVNHE